MNYISYNGGKCQLMMLLQNQFNKRTDFWIISITWLWLYSNLILYSFNNFDKRVFGLVGIKSLAFFFLTTILVMEIFNFQFSFRIKIGSWYYLTYCTSLLFLTFFNVLLNKSNGFRTMELRVVQLIVILFYLTGLTDLILYYLNLLYYWSIWAEYIFFLHILSLFARPQVNVLIVKFRLLPRKTSISGILLTFFH